MADAKTDFSKNIPDRIAADPDKAKNIGAIFLFKISGDNGGTWTLDLKEDVGVKEGEHGQARDMAGRQRAACRPFQSGAHDRQCRHRFETRRHIRAVMGQMVAVPFAELAPRRAIPSFVQRTSLTMRSAKPSPFNPTSVSFSDAGTRQNSSRSRWALWVRF